MITKIKAPVSVVCLYDHKKRLFKPSTVIWEGRKHKIVHQGYRHSYYAGKTLFHVFSAVSETVYFKLLFDTAALSWELEEVSDEEVD